MMHLFDIPHIIHAYGYFGIAAIIFFESGILFALPGDSLLFTAGILASGGILSIYTVVPVIFVSTFFGGVFGYYIGQNIEKLRKYSFFRKILVDKHMEKTHQFFEKHGRTAIVLSRFVPIVRTFTPIVAGIAKMKEASFLKYNLAGAFFWSMIVTLSGFYLGRQFPWLKDYMPHVILVVVILSVLPMVFEVIKERRKS